MSAATPGGIDLLARYDAGGFYDELLGADDEHSRTTDSIRRQLASFQIDDLRRRSEDAEREFQNLGITFLILSDNQAIDRILPFDVLPRIVTAAEWERLNAGVIQRVAVLNHFLHDVYHEQQALKDGIIPAELVLGNENFVERMVGVDLPFGTYVQILGVDLVRDAEGEFRVLEDNCRCPSGVSYVVENRHMMERAFPDLIGKENAVTEFSVVSEEARFTVVRTDKGWGLKEKHR